MQVVVAKWQDSTTFTNWTSSEEMDKSGFKVCYAAGFLLEKNEKVIKVSLLTSDDKKAFSNWINIPAGDVLELTVIKEVDWNES